MTTPIEGEYVPTAGEMNMTDEKTKDTEAFLNNCEQYLVEETHLTISSTERLMRYARIGASVMPRPTIIDILDERLRQITNEGWSARHDDNHKSGEMAYAAAWYALNAESHDHHDMVGIGNGSSLDHAFEDEFSWCGWPWDRKWWKPKDRRRDLVRAAALLVAEIERLDRAALPKPTEVTT